MKPYKLILILAFLFPAFQANAGILGERLHLGVSVGAGAGRLLDATSTGGAEDYGNFSFMAHAGLQLTPRWQVRLGLGLDNYFNFDDNSDTRNLTADDSLLFAGDIDLLCYVFKSLPIVDPYLVGGVGYPRVVHGGFGADVGLGDTFAVFGEVLYGTAFVDHRGQARLGLKVRF